MPQLIRKFIVPTQPDFIDLRMCDSSAGIDFFKDMTEEIKRCWYVNYKHDLKAIISYEFTDNDNKIIILMNII